MYDQTKAPNGSGPTYQKKKKTHTLWRRMSAQIRRVHVAEKVDEPHAENDGWLMVK